MSNKSPIASLELPHSIGLLSARYLILVYLPEGTRYLFCRKRILHVFQKHVL